MEKGTTDTGEIFVRSTTRLDDCEIRKLMFRGMNYAYDELQIIFSAYHTRIDEAAEEWFFCYISGCDVVPLCRKGTFNHCDCNWEKSCSDKEVIDSMNVSCSDSRVTLRLTQMIFWAKSEDLKDYFL